MERLPTASDLAHRMLAEWGRQASLDYLIDQLIDTDDEEEAANVSILIDAVERAAAH